MAGNGGKRSGAGRKKGSINKVTAKRKQVAAAALDSGITPLDYMLGVMRKPIPDDADLGVQVAMIGLRFEAAKAAAPYVHPRLAAIEHTGKDGGPMDLVWTINVVVSKK